MHGQDSQSRLPKHSSCICTPVVLMFNCCMREACEIICQNICEGGHAVKDMTTLHLKVQELCDCYAQTDPLKEMSLLSKDADKEEAALKWIALAVLHGVNMGAKQISISREDGKITVVAEYRDAELPSPGSDIGKRAIKALREITHIEEKKGELPLALGIRDSSLEVKVKVRERDNSETVTLKFGK